MEDRSSRGRGKDAGRVLRPGRCNDPLDFNRNCGWSLRGPGGGLNAGCSPSSEMVSNERLTNGAAKRTGNKLNGVCDLPNMEEGGECNGRSAA